MGLLDFLLSMENEKEKEESRKAKSLEDEMDLYGLEDEDRELVRNGDYNPWDFDQDDPVREDK